MAANVADIKRNWEHLKTLRLPHEERWRLCAEYFTPQKNMNVAQVPGELIKRRVTSSIGPRVLSRGSALLVAYLLDMGRPFISPNVDGAMVQAGRTLNLDAEQQDYLDTVAWRMFDAMLRPKSNYWSSTSRVAVELYAFGTGIRWTGRKRGFGPKYQHRALRSCWIDQNEDGEVDTVYYRYTLPIWRAVKRFPKLLDCEKIAKKNADAKQQLEEITLLQAVEPRENGRVGASSDNKPYLDCTIAPDFDAIAEETGYDSFPFSVARLNVEEGSPYGVGLAWFALPNVMAINAFRQGVEMATWLRVLPPILKPKRLFPKPLDQRPGAINSYDAVGLGFQNLRDAFHKLDIAGDPNAGANWIRDLTQEVEEIFFIDWMSLSDGVQKTAEEIRDRRDLRLRAMSALVPAVDRDLIGRDADRTLDCLIAEGLIPPPPASLSGANVEWDYKGPLAMLQQRSLVDAIGMAFDLALKGKQLDENTPVVVAIDECVRSACEALGLSPGNIRSRAEIEKQKEALAQAANDAHEAALAAQAGTTLRDGGNGIAALEGGLGGGRPPAPQQMAA